MISFKTILITFLFVFPVHSRINVKLTNLHCIVLDPGFTNFSKCSMKAVKKDVVEVTITAKLFKPISNASLSLSLKKRGDYKAKPIYYYKIDVCEFLRSSRRNPIADIFYKVFELERFSNLNHTCPYNHDIVVDRCRMNFKPLNMLTIAQGEYTIYTSWMVFAKPVADIHLYINIY